MLHRHAFPLAALAALLACLPDVEQKPVTQETVVAGFNTDPTKGAVAIPFPNDLALQSAATRPATDPAKALLNSFIAAGGFPVAVVFPPPTGSILIPIRTKDPTTGAYTTPTTAPVIDPAPLNDPAQNLVAFYRYDVSPAQKVDYVAAFQPQLPPTSPVAGPAIAIVPKAALPAGRYVVALRNGIKTTDGRSVTADQTIAIVAPNKSFSTVENWPPAAGEPRIPAAQAQQLEVLRVSFATPLPWAAVTAPVSAPAQTAICKGVLGATATSPCWIPCIPDVVTALTAAGAAALCAPLANAEDPFAAVSQAFPSEEVASIQTFKIVVAP